MNFQIATLLPEENVFVIPVIEILALISEITVPGLLRGVGIINKKEIIIITINTITNNLLFYLIKFFPLDKRKSKNIKSKDSPKAA